MVIFCYRIKMSALKKVTNQILFIRKHLYIHTHKIYNHTACSNYDVYRVPTVTTKFIAFLQCPMVYRNVADLEGFCSISQIYKHKYL